MVDSWAKAWKMNPYPEGYLPTVGYIVPDVACAFLFATDSDVSYIEAVLSNKDANEVDKDAAIDAITEAIVATAKDIGSKWLIGASSHLAVIDRAIDRHGFHLADAPVYQFIKELR